MVRPAPHKGVRFHKMPVEADAVAGLARLLSDPDPAVQAQAPWALGEMDTEPACLALKPGTHSGANGCTPDRTGPTGSVARAIADVPADYWTQAAVAGLLVIALLAMLAVRLIWKGPRPTAHHGHTDLL